MGQSQKATEIEVRWPNGQTETVKDIPVNQIVRIKEGTGLEKH
jgi:hypothetical protein